MFGRVPSPVVVAMVVHLGLGGYPPVFVPPRPLEGVNRPLRVRFTPAPTPPPPMNLPMTIFAFEKFCCMRACGKLRGSNSYRRALLQFGRDAC